MTANIKHSAAAAVLAAALAFSGSAALTVSAFADEYAGDAATTTAAPAATTASAVSADDAIASEADLMSNVAATGYCGATGSEGVPVYDVGGNLVTHIGTNLTWVIYTDGRLVISGTGDMCDKASSLVNEATPSAKGVTITSVEIQEGVTSIGCEMFAWMNKVTSIDVASSVTSVSYHAFPGESTNGCTVTVHTESLYNLLKCGNSGYVNNKYCQIGGSSSAYKTTNPKIVYEAPEPGTFRDVNDPSAWYYNSVRQAALAGYIEGYENGNFGPNDTLTRAQAAVILWRYYVPDGPAMYEAWRNSNSPLYIPFRNNTGMSDVASGSWYTMAANWAVSEGIINGYDNPDGTKSFSPDGTITREQLCTIIANAANKYKGTAITGGSTRLNNMPDAGSVDDWATDSVAWSLQNGVISGKDEDGIRYLDPRGRVTRAEMAAILMNSINGGLLQ